MASSLFWTFRPLFWLIGWRKWRIGEEGNHFAQGRHISPVSGESGLQPIVYFQLARCVGEGLFFGCIIRVCFWLSSTYRCFSSNVWSWLYWLCDQENVKDVNSPTIVCHCCPTGFCNKVHYIGTRFWIPLVDSHRRPSGSRHPQQLHNKRNNYIQSITELNYICI